MQVYMTTATSGATIFYTQSDASSTPATPTHNGSTPTGNTQVYNGSVNVAPLQSQTFKAIAYLNGMSDSSETQFTANNTGGPPPQSASTSSSSSGTAIVFSVWDGDWALLEEYGTENALIESYLQGYHGLVKTFVNDPDPKLPTVFYLWRGADWMEREVFDMYGISFDGHPDLRRLLMPPEFESYPLRKDYPLRGKGERHNFPVLNRAES